MTRTERSESSPSASMGLLATRRASVFTKGTRARSHSLLVAPVVALTALLCLLAFSAPALAATPETPETGTAEPTANTAVLHGTLNPKAPGQPGSYQFSYLPSATECVPGTLAPSFPTFADGLEKEAVQTTLTGLEPSREYAFCLIAYSILGANEPSAPSPAVAFTTEAAAPAVDAESTSAVTSTAATLEAQVNPNNQSTTYTFEYSTEQSGGVLQGTIVTVPAAPGGPLEGFGDQTASAATETLLPDTTYFYRVVGTNGTGTTDGTVSETGFTTVATPTTEAPAAVTSTTATFHGTLTPLTETPGAEAEYSFAYGQGLEDCAGLTSTAVTPAGTPKAPATVEAEATGLQPGTTYSVCLVSQNPFGAELDPSTPQQHFTTLAGPPSIEGETATNLTPEGATLETTVNPNNQQTTCSFEYSTEEAKVAAGEGTAVPCSQPLGAGGGSVTGSATVTGLQLHKEYFFRAIAENAAHEKTTGATIASFETETTVAPSLESEAATDITPTTAILTAKVNPNGAQLKACVFEYGTDTGYGHSAPCAHPDAQEVGAGREAVAISAALTGLSPNTTYHWRLTATSAAGTTTSVDHTFVEDTEPATPPGSCPGQEQVRKADRSQALPDCRAYEMVTPPQKNGALIGSDFGGGVSAPEIANDGQDVMVISLQCLAGTESCTGIRVQEGEPYEFARTGQGWVTRPLAPPATQFGITTELTNDANTHTTLFSALDATGTHDNFYVRTADGPPAEIGPVTQTGGKLQFLRSGGEAIESTADFSHTLFQGGGHGSALWSLDNLPETIPSVYEYATKGSAKPLAVGVSGGFESTTRISECFTAIGGVEETAVRNQFGSLSEDGHVVFFSVEGHSHPGLCSPGGFPVAPATNELLERVDNEAPGLAHTVLVSAPVAGSCASACQAAQSEPQDAEFEGASSDGSRVFFTSAQQLTDNASKGAGPEGRAGSHCHQAGGAGCNLYESVCVEPCGRPGEEPAAKERELVDVSEGEGGKAAEGGPRVQGVMAISSDGSHVYFVARGVLTRTQNAQGQEAEADANNLYVYERDEAHPEGRLQFIATLPQADEQEFFQAGKGPLEWDKGVGLANVTPDGRFLVFESHAADLR